MQIFVLYESASYAKGALLKSCLPNLCTSLRKSALPTSISSDNFSVDYVGVLRVGDALFIFMPKYELQIDVRKSPGQIAEATPEQWKRFVRIMKVIQKCEAKNIRKYIHTGDIEELKETDRIGLYMAIIKDYADNGAYRDDEKVVNQHGRGAILWQMTIRQSRPVFQDGKPYYLDPYTCTSETNEQCIFTRMHKAVVTACFREVQKLCLDQIFQLPGKVAGDEEPAAIGPENILRFMVRDELSVQYDSRRRYILQLMLAYFDKGTGTGTSGAGFQITHYGSSNFHTVWEQVCRDVIGNETAWRNDEDIKRLNSCCWHTEPHENSENIEVALQLPDSALSKSKQIPDIVTFSRDNDVLAIFDAKYYRCWVNLQTGKLEGDKPGIGDIRKQYLYEYAFRKWQAKAKDKRKRRNVLLFPKVSGDNGAEMFAVVRMPMFEPDKAGEGGIAGARDLEADTRARLKDCDEHADKQLHLILAFHVDADDLFERYLQGRRYTPEERRKYYLMEDE